ncbi:MAG: treZ, partial [Herminiimonas sp.]|nr:treZ [Herminiimonas sp.]
MSVNSSALPFGAQLLAPDRTRFRLWAPSAKAVSVELSGLAPAPLAPQADGWYQAEVRCGAGTRYKYRVCAQDGSELAVPDPASRAQDGDVHDASIVVDPQAYEWRNPSWSGRPWHETVLYELHAGAFGGFDGVAARLPELAALGITAVELMPIADFPGARNWGYDGVLPFAPDAAYGTPEQLKSLIDTAHELGMMVFLDVVYNHFGPDGNYLGAYAAPFFRDDINTPWGQAIDFRRREVRDFFTANALYWLQEYRFDGLRFDAVHAISEQDWLPEMAQRVRAAIDPRRHIHLVLEHDGNAASLLGATPEKGRLFDAQWNDDSHHVLHVMLTGEDGGYYEDYAQGASSRLARCLAEGFVYQGEPSPHRNGEPRGETSAHLPPTSFVMFLQNH